ncbi:hypothetical protein ACFTZI_14340 [Streptomyces decoyicus]|uniref:hypothetical protein n=1 Tax=Streptomyces decoyicus TaxID=249567 RepID=UPI00362FE8D1
MRTRTSTRAIAAGGFAAAALMFASSPAFAGTDASVYTTNHAGSGAFHTSGSVERIQVCDEKAGDGLYPVVHLKYGGKEHFSPNIGDGPDCENFKINIAEGTSVKVRIYLSRPGSDTHKYHASSWHSAKA